MKKLVLLLMLIGALRSFGAVATNVQHLSAFGTTNRTVGGDLIGLSTRPFTVSERLLGIRITNLVPSLNFFGAGTNTVIVGPGTNIIVVTTRTPSNVTYTISTSNNVSLVDVTNIVSAATNGFSSVSPPISSVQYNSNGVQSGSSGFVFTNGNVGIGTNAPVYPLSLHQSDITEPALNISYDTGAGNTIAFQIQNGTGLTNFLVEVDGLVRSVTVHNSGSITSAVATLTALNVTGGTLGAGKILMDTGGTGAATWETPSSGVDAATVTNIVLAGPFIRWTNGFGTNTTFAIQTNQSFIQWTNLARLEPETNLFSTGTGILALRNGTNPQEFWINQTYATTNNQTGIRMWGSGASMYIQAMSRPSGSCSLILGAGETGDGSSDINFQVLDVTKVQIDVNGALKPGVDLGSDLGVAGTRRWNNAYIGNNLSAANISATTIAGVGGLATTPITVATNYTAATNIAIILVNTAPSNITVTLPFTGVSDGHHYWIKNISTNLATITPTSAVIDLGANYVLTNQFQAIHLAKQATNWWIFGAQ